jgi:hypothetical protein
MNRPSDTTAAALRDTLVSPNECDSHLEPANVVDALFFIGRQVGRLATALERLAPATDGDGTPRPHHGPVGRSRVAEEG